MPAQSVSISEERYIFVREVLGLSLTEYLKVKIDDDMEMSSEYLMKKKRKVLAELQAINKKLAPHSQTVLQTSGAASVEVTEADIIFERAYNEFLIHKENSSNLSRDKILAWIKARRDDLQLRKLGMTPFEFFEKCTNHEGIIEGNK